MTIVRYVARGYCWWRRSSCSAVRRRRRTTRPGRFASLPRTFPGADRHPGAHPRAEAVGEPGPARGRREPRRSWRQYRTDLAAKSRPDGYTLVTGNNGTFAANVSLYKKLPFDPVKDFTPIVLVATQPNVLVVNLKLPVRSVKELIAYAKTRPGKLNYGNSGIGRGPSGGRAVQEHDRCRLQGDPVQERVAGAHGCHKRRHPSHVCHVPLGAATHPVEAGTPPGGDDGHPHPRHARPPTIAEAGVPGFEATTWHGVFVPAGTPAAIVGKLNAEINRILQMPDIRDKLAGMGAEIVGGTSQEFADHIQREIVKWAKVIKDANISIDQ